MENDYTGIVENDYRGIVENDYRDIVENDYRCIVRSDYPYINNNKNNIKNNITNNKNSLVCSTRKRYGVYKNVFLTDEEFFRIAVMDSMRKTKNETDPVGIGLIGQ